jgi:hypothetical protein
MASDGGADGPEWVLCLTSRTWNAIIPLYKTGSMSSLDKLPKSPLESGPYVIILLALWLDDAIPFLCLS